MAEEVDIGNVGGKGVASEETLASLVRAVEFMAKKAGYDAKAEAAKVQKLHNAAVKAGTKATKDSVDVIDLFNDEVKEATDRVSAMGRGFNVLVAGLSGIVGSLSNFGEELLGSSTELESFAKHIPLVGGIMGTLAGILDDTVDSFRNMTNAGIDFGGSIFEVRRMAAQSGLSLETFQQVVTSNSEALALFGGGARGGARAFANVSKIVQGQFGQGLSNLGFTMEQTAEYTADYLDLQRRLGRNQRMSDAQLAQGTSDYILMLDKLSKITGKQRDQIQASLQNQREDAVIAALLSTLDAAGREALSGVLTITESMGPEFNSAISDMVATGGVPMSEFGKALIVANPALGSLSRGLAQGTVTQAEFMAGLRTAADDAMNMSDEQVRTYTRLARAQQGESSERALAILTLRQFTEIGEGANDALDAQREAANRGEHGILDFARRITDLRNIIVGTMIDSGVFGILEDGFNTLINFFTSPTGMATVKTAIEDIGSFFNTFISDMQTGGFWNTLQQYFYDGVQSLWDMISTQLFGSTEAENTQRRDSSVASVDEQIASVRQERMGRMTSRGNNTDELAVLDAQLQQLESQRQELMSSDTSATEGMLGGLLPDVNALTIGLGVVGGVGLIAALYALSPALGAIAGPALALGAAIGMGAGGLGLLFEGLSSTIEATGESISGIMDSFTRFRTEGINATTDQIERLNRIPADTLQNTADGVLAMKEALANFGPSTGSTLFSMITGGADNEQMANTASQIERLGEAFGTLEPEKIISASSAVTAMGNSLVAFATGLAADAGAGILSSIRGWFGGEDDILNKINEMAAAFGNINGPNLVETSTGISSMGASLLESASGIGALAEVNMRNLERFSNVSFDNLSGLGEFAQISGLESQFTAISNGVADFENVNAYASAIENLVEQLSELNEELSKDNNGWGAGTGTNAGDVLGSINMSSQGSSEGIDRLNTLMSQMLVILTQSKELETRIERNTASLGGDLSRGRVTNIR